MILLWGLSGDEALEEVAESLRSAGAEFVLLDQREVLETELEMDFGAAPGGVVRAPRGCIDLGGVTSAYLRVYDSRRLSRVARTPAGSPERAHALAVEGALYTWTEVTRTLVVNRPSAMASNGSKPFQAALIRAHGFAVAETLVTTDPDAARAFWAAHGEVVYKSASSVRSVVSRLGPGHLERLDDLRWCPTQLQRRVPGTDYRVHVVGREVFPCEIASDVDDYRYARRQGGSARIRPCELPGEVAERSRALVAALGLAMGGVDLRRTPDGEWVCFEVNPSPGFTFYAADGDRTLADAVARLLMAG